MASPLPTCPACGELRHPDLCKPAIQTMLAEEKLAHQEDQAELQRLTTEVERLRREIERSQHA